MFKNEKPGWMALLALTIIALTCVATDFFYLHRPHLAVSALPILFLLLIGWMKWMRLRNREN